MSRITGSEVASLMEAYSAVYAPQELTEEQIWEEVENWVNSLLEEGYDLSEYTWEEIYESYLAEGPFSEFNKRKEAEARSSSSNPLTALGTIRDRLKQAGAAATGKYYSSSDRKYYANYNDAVAARNSRRGVTNPKPDPTPDPTTDRDLRRNRNLAATTTAAPKVAPTKPASAQTGDKVKDMDTWAKANPKLAAAAAERARTRGTSSTTNPQMADMKSRLPAAAPKVAPSNALSSTVAAASKPAAFNPAPEVKATNTIAAAPKPAPVAPRQQRLNMEMEYDAYDVVLEYLLSEGHVETVEEAHYVMMEMDAEMVQDIVEAAKDQSDKQIDKGVKTTYKAGNVLDNTHQGRSPGLNKLPRGEREEKAQRMRGRLKARRDDLFGERNKREDAAREEIKKKYGL
jgi:hypothetical protein